MFYGVDIPPLATACQPTDWSWIPIRWSWSGLAPGAIWNEYRVVVLSLTLRNDVIPVAEAVRVLGVVITPDLWLDKHVTAVSAKCFLQLWQLRRVHQLLENASVATLVHAFVTSLVDYCNCLLAGATKPSMDKLQHVMNAGVWVVSESHKFDCWPTNICHNDLFDVSECITFSLCIMVYECLHDMAQPYLSELCWQTCNVEGRHQLRSVTRGNLDVPRCRLWTYGRRNFCAGPAARNSLPDHLKNSTLTIEQFRHLLKYFLFLATSARSELEIFIIMRIHAKYSAFGGIIPLFTSNSAITIRNRVYSAFSSISRPRQCIVRLSLIIAVIVQ